MGSFIKTAKWDKWTEQHNIPPGIIGIIEEIFKKMEELEKEQKRKQEELEKEQKRKQEELESKKLKLDPKKKEQV